MENDYNSIRSYMYKIKKGNFNIKDLIKLFDLLEELYKYKFFNNYINNCYLVLESFNLLNTINSFIVLEKYSSYKNYKCFNYNKNFTPQEKELILNQISSWYDELKELIDSDINYKRQIELAQNINQQLISRKQSIQHYLLLNDERIPFSSITPRFLMERKLNVVMIKASAYKLGVSATIRKNFLKHGNGVIGEYIANLGSQSKYGIKTMRIFHPHGYKYERSMCGKTDVFLIHETAVNLSHKKRKIRQSLGKNCFNKSVIWFDGKPIFWDPIVTNLVHSTDTPSEASMHYLASYPEEQLMTRFMYPNIKLSY